MTNFETALTSLMSAYNRCCPVSQFEEAVIYEVSTISHFTFVNKNKEQITFPEFWG